MRNKYLTDHLLGAAFAFLFSVCAAGCLITGWDLNVASTGRLYLWCGIFAVLMPLLLYFRFGWIALLLLSVRGAFALWADGALWEQIQTLAYTVSTHFKNVYNWRVIGENLSAEYDLVLILAAYYTSLCVSLCICRRMNIVFVLPPVLLPLVLCLIATDTLPAEKILFLIIFGIALLLVTDWARRRDPGRFAEHIVRVILPVGASLILLFALNPQEEYVNHAAELQKKATEFADQLMSRGAAAVGSITESRAVPKLNLRRVGPKSDFSYTVMRVTAPYSGVVYLRGRDYDVYTGTMWESSGGRTEVLPAGDGSAGLLSITTYTVRSVLYTPYYSSDAVTLTDGFVENTENLSSYSYYVSRTPAASSDADVAGYTELPPETAEWAVPFAERITSGAAKADKVRLIGDYVRNSASYDLDTSAMSHEYDDFARWFLEKGETGYCVHFATAAAVLLRAAGIPARYVEGYMIDCVNGEEMLVSNLSAHAWVEYYDGDSSLWRVLEATPADALVTGETAADEPEPDETEPEETEPDETDPEEAETEEMRSEDEASDKPETGGEAQNTGAGKPGIGGSSGSGGSSATAGNTGSGNAAVQRKEPFRIPEWVKTAALIVLAASLVPLQSRLRAAFRRKRWYTGAPNEMAVTRWKQSKRLARLMKTELPHELDELALKAKFSQHTITADELYSFEVFRQRMAERAGGMPWYKRLLLRWVFAVV